MWCVWILLGACLCVDSYSVHDQYERLSHGRQLKIYLPKSVEKLEFSPAASPGQSFLYWSGGSGRMAKGRVTGTASDRRWYLDSVTFEDEGTYTQKDYWNKEISVLKVAVTTRQNYLKRVAGESLYISLEGIRLEDATLSFYGPWGNATLVRDGAPVGQDLADYYDRVKTHATNVELTGFNASDVGYYTLRDRRDRVVALIKADLTDHHDQEGNPLLALLLLLGIPAGICCCCRKRIFKSKSSSTTSATFQQAPGSPEATHPPPAYGMPAGGVSPGYPGAGQTVHPPPNPGMAGPQWNGPPPAMNPGYPPQDPLYPPLQPPQWNGPPPAQAPQWNGPPQGQYTPGGPMGYAPVYGAPPPSAGEPVKTSPVDPLLAHPPPQEVASSPLQPPAPPPGAPSTDVLGASDIAHQFQIDTGKNSTNFL